MRANTLREEEKTVITVLVDVKLFLNIKLTKSSL